MTKRILFFIFFLPIISFAQKEVFTQSFVSLDNENQFNVSTYQGFNTYLDSLFKRDSIFIKRKTNLGIANGLRYYQTNINEPTYFFNEAKIYFKTTPIKKLTIIFNPSLVMSKGFSTFAYEFSSSYQIKKCFLELSSERDLVGARALQVNLVSNYYGLSVDYSPIKHLTLVGGYQYNYITDNNKRSFFLTRIIYTLPSEKIYFDLRSRDMRGGEWSEYYFSPERISQRQIGVGVNKTYWNEKGIFKGYFGTGFQTIDTQTMYLLTADLKFDTQIINRLRSELVLGIRNFNTYIYSFGTVKLKYSF